MINIVLNIIGITLVLYSIFIIRKDISMKRNDNNYFKEEIDNEEYYKINEEKVEDFNLLIDNKMKLTDLEKKEEVELFGTYKKTIPIIKDHRISSTDDNTNPLHKKIMELESIGLSNEEIAKKMGKGIREIDIILKIYKKDFL